MGGRHRRVTLLEIETTVHVSHHLPDVAQITDIGKITSMSFHLSSCSEARGLFLTLRLVFGKALPQCQTIV